MILKQEKLIFILNQPWQPAKIEELKSNFIGRPEVPLAYLLGATMRKRVHKLSDIEIASYAEPTRIRDIQDFYLMK